MSACDNVGPLLDGYHDGELDAFERRRVEQHVVGCDACRRDLASLGAVGQAVRAALAGTPAPDLWDAIARELPAARPRRAGPAHPRTPLRRRWTTAVAAVAVAASVSVLLVDPAELLAPAPDRGPSGMVRSVYSYDRPVMVMEGESSDDPTIIWLMNDPPQEGPHVGI